jgi:hypothetical protein
MTDQEYVQIALERWHLMPDSSKHDLIEEWISTGALLDYIYEELHYTDDAGVEYEEGMDYEDIEEIYVYRQWIPKIVKELKGH